jgi:hypothetical protein
MSAVKEEHSAETIKLIKKFSVKMEDIPDGSYIIYVNGSYQGDDPLGKLLHDFRCKHSSEMFYEELSDGMKHFKEVEGGREVMCEAVEEYANEKARIAAEKTEKKKAESMAIKMLQKKI